MKTDLQNAPLSECWDMLNRNDRESVAVCCDCEHVIDGWQWDQISTETQNALIEADNHMRGV